MIRINAFAVLVMLSAANSVDLRPFLPPVPNVLGGKEFLSKPFVSAPRVVIDAEAISADPDLQARRWGYWPILILSYIVIGACVAHVVPIIIVRVRMCVNSETQYTNNKKHPYNALEGRPPQDEWTASIACGIISSAMSVTFMFFVIGFASVNNALSPRTGLAWELWALFAMYNVVDALVQATFRGLTAPLGLGEVTKYGNGIFVKAVSMNLPGLSIRIDYLTDTIFIALAVQGENAVIAILGMGVLLHATVRAWVWMPFAVRSETLAIVAPFRNKDEEARETPKQFVELVKKFSGALSNFSVSLADKLRPYHGKAAEKLCILAEENSAPLKLETVLVEDLPQAILQVVLMWTNHTVSVFLIANAVVQAVKACTVFSMIFFLLDCEWSPSGHGDGEDNAEKGPAPEPNPALLTYAYKHLRNGPMSSGSWKILERPRQKALVLLTGAVSRGHHTPEAERRPLADILIQATENTVMQVRQDACHALGEVAVVLLPGEDNKAWDSKKCDEEEEDKKTWISLVEALLNAFKAAGTPDGVYVRQAAVKALVEAHQYQEPTNEIVDVFRTATRDRDNGIRIYAVGALCMLGKAEFRNKLLKQLLEDANNVHGHRASIKAALWSLGKVYQHRGDDLGRQQKTGILDALHKGAKHQCWDVRRAAVLALGAAHRNGGTPKPKTFEELGKAVSDQNTNVRKAALSALGEVSLEHAPPALLPQLAQAATTFDNGTVGVRKGAVLVLAKLQDQSEKVQEVLEKVRDRDDEKDFIRNAAREALRIRDNGTNAPQK